MTTRSDRPNAEWSSCTLGARGDSGGGGACTIRRRCEGYNSVVVAVILVTAWYKSLYYQ
jgi:hypothetical protein